MEQDKTQDLALGIFKIHDAIITDSHVVYASDRHGDKYANKDAVYPHTHDTSTLCRLIAEHFVRHEIDVVVAPAVGGTILSQWTAYHLKELVGYEVLGVYADKETVAIKKNQTKQSIAYYLGTQEETPCVLKPGESLVIETGNFVIKRGYDKLVTGRRVLVVEDILTTGGSIRKTIEAVRNINGRVIAAAALCNRGSVTAEAIGAPELFSLINIDFQSYNPAECLLCKAGVPINTNVGKGKQFLERQGK